MRLLVLTGLAASTALAASGLGASAPGTARCVTRQLTVAPGGYGVAAGSFVQKFTFTNTSRHACSLRGWPHLASQRNVRVQQTRPGTRAFRTVTLGATGKASFNVYGADFDARAGRTCPSTSVVRITPPGAHTALTVAVRIPACGRLYVAPIVPGTGNRDSWSVVWHG